MSMFIVVRHTRGDEEAGRLELVGAGVVGSAAALTAGLLTALLANLGVGLLVAVGLTVAGLPRVDSLGFGLGMAGVGCVFAAITALAAQLAASARTAIGIVTSVLGAGLPAAGGGRRGDPRQLAHALSWASRRSGGPCSCGRSARSLVGAGDLGAGRDRGDGRRVRARRAPGPGHRPAAGPARARRGRGEPAQPAGAGLAAAARPAAGLDGRFRGVRPGHRAAWPGSAHNSSATTRPPGSCSSRWAARAGLVNAFLAAIMGIMGVLASVYAVQAALRLRGEESGQRAEPVLAAAVGRIRGRRATWCSRWPGPGRSCSPLVGLGMGLVHGAQHGDVGETVAQLLGSALVQLPAVLGAGRHRRRAVRPRCRGWPCWPGGPWRPSCCSPSSARS